MAKGDRRRTQLGGREVEEVEVDSVRFAVGSPDGPRSSTWRVWGNKKGDFYLAVRSLGGSLKTSLHTDRRCHTGFTSDFVKKGGPRVPSLAHRHWDRWELPNEPIVNALSIIFPGAELRAFKEVGKPAPMKWLDPPGSDELLVVSVYVLRPDVPGDTWPGSAHGSQPVGKLVAGNRVAWVVSTKQPADGGPRIQKIDALTHVVDRDPGTRLIVATGPDEHGRRFFIEKAADSEV